MTAGLFTSCSIFSSTVEPKDARAFFVTPKNVTLVSSQNVQMTGDINEIVELVRSSLHEHLDTTTSVIRYNQDTRRRTLGVTPIMKIKTPYVMADSLDSFKEYFKVGAYVTDIEDMDVRPEDLQYRVEADIIYESMSIIVEFKAFGYINWNVYQLERGEFRKLEEKDEEKVGVGQFETQNVIRTMSRLGEPLVEYKWETTIIEDQPISKGVLEMELNDVLIELAAIEDLHAMKVGQ